MADGVVERSRPRDRILETAQDMFHKHGIKGVGDGRNDVGRLAQVDQVVALFYHDEEMACGEGRQAVLQRLPGLCRHLRERLARDQDGERLVSQQARPEADAPHVRRAPRHAFTPERERFVLSEGVNG